MSGYLRRGLRIPLIGSALLAIFLVAGAVRGLWDAVYFREIVRVADRLEHGASLDPQAIPRLASLPALAAAERRCATARAAATLRIAGFDATPRGRDVFQDDAVLDAAAGAIDHALRCFPLDGYLWLRSATVSLAAAGPGEEVSSALTISSWTAPNEVWVLRQRLLFAARLLDAGLEANGDLLRADIRQALRHLRPDELARFYGNAGVQTRLLYRETLPFVEPVRRERIEALFDVADRDATGVGPR